MPRHDRGERLTTADAASTVSGTVRLRPLALVLAVCMIGNPFAVSHAQVPALYATPGFESPVRADPDDLLMLGGHGFSAGDVVVYDAVVGAAQVLTPPKNVPTVATAERGYAPVVSRNALPDALTIRLPDVLHKGRPYALWVRTDRGEWSRPVEINDARPLWLTPAFSYATAHLANLPRYLKIVGRNLDAAGREVTSVRLTGPDTVTIAASRSNETVDGYVAQVALPPRLNPGRYIVSVRRDASGWVELRDQTFEVRPDPAPDREFSISEPRFGACRPNLPTDATGCLVKAIEAASEAGGGSVVFGRGDWTLIDSRAAGVAPLDGIVIPQGVSLRGMGSSVTRLIRDPEWNSRGPMATLSLRGNNRVEDLTFRDSQIYTPDDRIGPYLKLGEASARSHRDPSVRHVVITHDRFDRTDTAIGDAGFAIEEIFITYNEFGAYRNDLELGGDVFNVANRFRIDDSVVAHNVFEPGSYIQPHDRQGAIAAEMGASHRVDFSDNDADGTATRYLYAADDPPGWRAGFFWHMNDSLEELLISNNEASCTGDKAGDGEAIALDNSGNTFAFDTMRTVTAAGPSSVTVDGPLAIRQNGRIVPVATYYVGHWVQVGDGTGMGQTRRIIGYVTDDRTGRITFSVAPAWDVVPQGGVTRIAVGREFWQTFIIGNRIEHRSPPCRGTQRQHGVGGTIALWGQLADSVVAANEQQGTDGITLHENYNAPDPHCQGCASESFFQSFLVIRDNRVRGKYDDRSDCSASGITGGVSSAPNLTSPPPTLGYGIDIAHNDLEQADNSVGGAISMAQDWFDGPPPHRWPLIENLLIQHNRIEGTSGPNIGVGCRPTQPRRGISFPGSPLTKDTVLYGNSCHAVQLPLGPGGWDDVAVCPDGLAGSCECPDQAK